MTEQTVRLVTVFADGPNGGNPAPVVVDADGMSDDEMREIAQRFGHESGFVQSAVEGSSSDYAFRFFVPNHEMEMCGHATVGAVWLLDKLGRLERDAVTIATASGSVDARLIRSGAGTRVEIAQPKGWTEAVGDEQTDDILDVLGIARNAIAQRPIRNARTSRTKTLIPMASVDALDALAPDFDRIEALCERIGSTGLYPYAVADERLFDARQFPKSSGYPEDAATGIAAAALAFGLLADGLVEPDATRITVRQGRAMGRPSRIELRFRLDDKNAVVGCWLGGAVHLDQIDEGADGDVGPPKSK